MLSTLFRFSLSKALALAISTNLPVFEAVESEADADGGENVTGDEEVNGVATVDKNCPAILRSGASGSVEDGPG